MNIKSNIELFFVVLFTAFYFIKILLFPAMGSGMPDNSVFTMPINEVIYYTSFVFILNILLFVFFSYTNTANKLFFVFIMVFSLLVTVITSIYLYFFNTFGQLYFYNTLFCLGNLLISFTFFFVVLFSVNIYKRFLFFMPFFLVLIFFVYSLLICWQIPFNERLEILYKHSNHLGNALSFGILFLSFSVFSFKSKVLKTIICAVVFVLCLGLVGTLSRGAWLGLGVGLLFGIATAFVYSKNKVNILKIVLSLVLAFSISVFIVNPSRITERFNMSVKDTEISTMNRATLWKASLLIINDHPLIGVGLGNFGDVLDKDYKTEFLNNESFATALNNYLTLAAEVGIPLALLYIFIVIYALVLAVKSIAQSRKEEQSIVKSDNKFLSKIIGFVCIDNYFYIKVGMLAGVISLLVFGLTTYTLTRVYSNLLLWLSLGYILADYKIKDK